jgi:hypothetical protein
MPRKQTLRDQASKQRPNAMLVRALNLPKFTFPSGVVLCGANPNDAVGRFAFRMREVDMIIIYLDQRRVDLRWVDQSARPRWLPISNEVLEAISRSDTLGSHRRGFYSRTNVVIRIGSHTIDIHPKEITYIGVRSLGQLFLFPESPVVKFLAPYFERSLTERTSENTMAVVFLCELVDSCVSYKISEPDDFVRQSLRRFEDKWPRTHTNGRIDEFFDHAKLVELVGNSNWQVFDPGAWQRGSIGFW